MIFSQDKNEIKAKIDEVTGFLTSSVVLSRTGSQNYYGYELGLPERAFEIIPVMRTQEEVFRRESLDSFINLVVTNDHPMEDVTVENVKRLQVGSVSNIEADKAAGVVTGVITITDKKTIEDILEGKKEVSVGYTYDLTPAKEDTNGYEFEQKNIKGNHLAIVQEGRCGTKCKMILDNKGEAKIMGKKLVRVAGIDFEIENNDALAQAIAKDEEEMTKKEKELSDKIKALAQENEELKKRLGDQEEEKKEKDQEEEEEEEKKEKDKGKDAAKLEADVLSRAQDILVIHRILDKDMPAQFSCINDLKKLVVKKVFGFDDFTNKSKGYLQMAFDMALKAYGSVKSGKSNQDSMFNLVENLKSSTGGEGKKDSREEYMKTFLKIQE